MKDRFDYEVLSLTGLQLRSILGRVSRFAVSNYRNFYMCEQACFFQSNLKATYTKRLTLYIILFKHLRNGIFTRPFSLLELLLQPLVTVKMYRLLLLENISVWFL